MQCILSALVTIIIAIAPVFNIPLTVVPPKGELPHESEPAPSELSVYDKVVGVDDSVFYISRPNVENMKIIYASDFGMDSNSQDNTDAFCRAIDYCRRNPGARLVIDAGEYRFSPKNTIGLNSLKDVLIDAEGAVFVFDCDRYFEISGCENFEIKGLAVDWVWDESRFASVVKIEKRNAIKHTFDMRFTELDEVPEDIAVMVMTQLQLIRQTQFLLRFGTVLFAEIVCFHICMSSVVSGWQVAQPITAVKESDLPRCASLTAMLCCAAR